MQIQRPRVSVSRGERLGFWGPLNLRHVVVVGVGVLGLYLLLGSLQRSLRGHFRVEAEEGDEGDAR
jgi:hypothetical protein